MEVFTSHTRLKNIKLRPRDNAMLNLRLKVNLPDKIEAMIGLLPNFVSRKLLLENSNWISNKRTDEIIQLDILNRHFCNTTNIRKNQEFAYKFLINQKVVINLLLHIIFIIYNFLKTNILKTGCVF